VKKFRSKLSDNVYRLVIKTKKIKLKLEVLEKKATMHILIALFKEGRKTVSELIYVLPFSQTAIYSAKERLEKAGLIKKEIIGEFPKTIIHSLTPKGRKVAEKLLEIEKILES